MSADYRSNGCDDCDDETLAQEMPLDKAFFEVFDDLSVIQNTVDMGCFDNYTLNYSVNVTGKLKGVPTPITWRERLLFQFNEYGLITKITNLTPFTRNLREIFKTLLLSEPIGDEEEDTALTEEEEGVPMIDPESAQGMESGMESGYQMYTVTMVLVALIVSIAVVIGVCTGTWISLHCSKRPAVVQYDKV